MKTKIFMGALVALLAVACAKEQLPEQKESTAEGLAVTASVEQPGDGTKTSLDGLSVKWSVGDRICLKSADGTKSAIYKATTASSSTSFSFVSGDTIFEGDVYAYYPADNVTDFSAGVFTATIPAVQPYVAGGFADGVNPMTAKATVVEGSLVLSFKNVMSFVKLQIADNAAGKTLTSLSLTSTSADLCGTATVTVGPDGAATTAITSGDRTVKLSGLSAPLIAVATPLYIAVPAGNLGYLTITAKTSESTGSWSQDKTATSTLTAARSSINSYNPMLILSFENRTMATELPANCYMVDATKQTGIIIPLSQAIAGWDAIKALEPLDTFDKTKITSGTRSIAVRWFDDAGGTGEIIEMTNIDNEKMTLNFNGCSNGSNAVVDLKNSDEIVWSWHIWFTDYKPGATQAATQNGQVHTYSGPAFQESGLYYGKVVMDRDLGATVTDVSNTIPISQPTTEAEAQKYWGLFYQFGRKDPFATTGTVTTTQDVTTTKVTYAQAALAPATFFGTNTSTSDAWCKTDAEAVAPTDPWNSNGTKSAFDPCPVGWRIPNNGTADNKNIWAGMTVGTWKSGSDNTSGQLWNNAWLPVAGLRVYRPSGNVANRGASVYYWTASPRENKGSGYYSQFSSTSVNIANTAGGSRAFGMPIRCVKE